MTLPIAAVVVLMLTSPGMPNTLYQKDCPTQRCVAQLRTFAHKHPALVAWIKVADPQDPLPFGYGDPDCAVPVRPLLYERES